MPSVDDSMREAMTPLYRAMGAAMQAAQSYEYSLGFLLALIAEQRRPNEREILAASLELRATQTLGTLVHDLTRELSDLPTEIEDYLREGLEARNRLVHGFFPRNTERLMSPKGRIELERELKVTALEIRSRDKIVWSLIEKYLRKHGIASDELRSEVDALWRALSFEPEGERSPSKH